MCKHCCFTLRLHWGILVKGHACTHVLHRPINSCIRMCTCGWKALYVAFFWTGGLIHTYWGVVLVLRLRFMLLFSVVQLFSRPSRAMVYTIVLSTESQDDEDLLTPIWTHEVSTRKEGLQICRLLRRLFRALGYRANFFHLSVESS